jgi:DnaJ-class molecular chaperone
MVYPTTGFEHACPGCQGIGAVPCGMCDGLGQVSQAEAVPAATQASRDPQDEASRPASGAASLGTCPDCHGDGAISCMMCHGKGTRGKLTPAEWRH